MSHNNNLFFFSLSLTHSLSLLRLKWIVTERGKKKRLVKVVKKEKKRDFFLPPLFYKKSAEMSLFSLQVFFKSSFKATSASRFQPREFFIAHLLWRRRGTFISHSSFQKKSQKKNYVFFSGCACFLDQFFFLLLQDGEKGHPPPLLSRFVLGGKMPPFYFPRCCLFYFWHCRSTVESQNKATLQGAAQSQPLVNNSTRPTTNGGIAKWKPSRNMVRVACTFFARSAPTRNAQSARINKISASELSRKFY